MPLSIRALVAFCLMAPAAVALGAKAARQHDIHGVWSFEYSGGCMKFTVDEETRKSMRMTFEGNKLSMTAKDKAQPVADYAIDPSSRTMDMMQTSGGAKKPILAIYELKGDVLKICFYEPAFGREGRPKDFIADKDTVLIILKREKK